MAHPRLDYSDLTPEERLQLVEDLWDSLAVGAPESVPIPASHAEELERRVAAFRADRNPGPPWRDALDEIDANLKRRGG
jgi:putative addiction module component (TIGR02574 family)